MEQLMYYTVWSGYWQVSSSYYILLFEKHSADLLQS